MSAKVTQILPGLVRFNVPFPHDPRRSVNSFVLSAGDEALLLDASWDTPAGREGLEAALDMSGLSVEAVRTVAITHMHVDHIGLAGQLQQLGARIAYHSAEAFLRTRYQRLSEFREHIRIWERLNGYANDSDPSLSNLAAVENTLHEVPPPDQPLLGGELLEIGQFRLRPIWTPGHTLGHVCYLEETQGLLFTGDHVLPTISPHVGLYSHSISNPLPNYLDSLKHLLRYQPDLVIPAHGEVFTDLHGRVNELIEHHHERMEEMFDIVRDEPLTGWDVASRAHWTRRKVTLDQLAAGHRRLAMAETLAHLELLRAENRLTKDFAPGRMLYRRAARG